MNLELSDDFVRSEGASFLAHLLRRLSDEFVRGCEQWYPQFGLTAPPRTASTLHLLYRRGAKSVTEIATDIRQSHPLVITWIRQLKVLGLVRTLSDPNDKRRTVVVLTETGLAEARRMLKADKILEKAYKQLMREADAELFETLSRIENACKVRSFYDRLAEAAGR